jgi:hypothetical protein
MAPPQDGPAFRSRRAFLQAIAWAPGLFLPAPLYGRTPRRIAPLLAHPHTFPFQDFRLAPHYPTQSPLEDVLRLVTPGLDGYIGEKYAFEIMEVLRAWSKSLKDSPPALDPVFLAPQIEAASLRPSHETSLRSAGGIEVLKRSFASTFSPGREHFLREVAAYFKSLGRIETAEFQIVAIEEASAAAPVKVDILKCCAAPITGARSSTVLPALMSTATTAWPPEISTTTASTISLRLPARGLPNRLYRNRGDGTFEDVTEQSGLGVLDDTACALFADFENKGLQDLLVVCGGGPLLFLNQGNGKFKLKPDAFKFARPPQGTFTHAAIADYDRDGRLDIYFCLYSYYVGLDQYHYPVPYFDARNGPPNFLLHNEGNSTFTDRTEAAGLNAENDRYSFACAWGDSQRGRARQTSTWPTTFGRNNLYRNNGDGTFTAVSTEAGVETLAPA